MTATQTTPSTDDTTDNAADAGTRLHNSDPVETVQALYAAFGAGDLDRLKSHIHPDVDWSTTSGAPDASLVPMLVNGRGHAAVDHYFGGVAQLEFHTFSPVRFLADGEVVYVELSLDLEHRITGKRAAFGEIHRFVVRDGLVVEYRGFLDTGALIEVYRP